MLNLNPDMMSLFKQKKQKIAETNYGAADLYFLQQHAEQDPVSVPTERQQKMARKSQLIKNKRLAPILKRGGENSILIMSNNIDDVQFSTQ